ncbi:BTAD domain-containing putative transcriptional regulator [Micromonospora sp. NPDC049559]|uniref:AfsR/SARP family transcriptional regulator n=1 Tax=Micromonospora sp. NPDC049559 TaxID=3155923 RepID=UPI0034435434
MRIGLLGPLEVQTGSGARVEVSGARLRRLLILLALDAGRVVPSAELVDGVWGDEPPSGTVNALQALVSRLRRAVPEAPVDSHPSGYRLAVAAEAVDLARFERLAAAGRAALPVDPARAVAVLTEALALWRGPALADVADADFARAPVARLDELRLGATEDRIEALLALGEAASLIPELRALVAAHPVRERPAGQLIRALRAAGRPAEALAGYDRIRTALAETLGTDPSPELAALHLELLRGAPVPVPPGPRPAPGDRPAGDAPAGPGGTDPDTRPAGIRPGPADGPGRARHNLPAGLTSFIGREEELRRVRKLLAEARLVTLTGPGGAGKTRLAVESARELLGQAPDGVWLVELAPVTDPADLPQTVLTVLGLREQALLARRGAPSGELADPLGRLVGAIEGRDLLLILDNCEHLVGAAAELADRLLAAGPRLRVLATSREPLGITGEVLHPVESLALPPVGAGPEQAGTYPAVRLLADRARAVRPDFAVDDRNVAAVVRICRALDGMPLAIELAAARLRALGAAQIAARLDDRFRLLTAGSRTALPRHQTLRAVVDWSWDLTDEPERAVLRRLAVFAGGATLEAAERVCAGDGVDPADVLDRLTALVDKSLVIASGDGDPRYRLLETIREYGLRRLAEAGEEERVRRAHVEEFLSLAETADAYLRGREQLRWLARLAAEHDNLHAALRWTVGAGDGVIATRFVGALGWYWWLRGHRLEGADLAKQALALPGVEEAPGASPVVAYALGALNVLSARAEMPAALEWLRRGARLAEARSGAHPMLRLIGPMAASFQRYDPTTLDALVPLFDDPDPWTAGIARMMHAHGQLNFGLAENTAETDFSIALGQFREIGERWGAALTLAALADVLSRRGEHGGATGLLGEALDQLRALGSLEDVPELQLRLAHELWLLGERHRAVELLTEADREAERLGSDEARVALGYEWAAVLRDQGDWAAARRRLMASVELTSSGRRVPPQWRAMVQSSLGYVAAAEGELDAARTHHDRALDAAIESHDAPIAAQVLMGYADLTLRLGRPARAARLIGAADAVRGGPDRSLLDGPRIERAVRDALGPVDFAAALAAGAFASMATIRDVVRAAVPSI